jgi:hypothetical protein
MDINLSTKISRKKLPTTDFWNSVQTVTGRRGEAGAVNTPGTLAAPHGFHPFVDAAFTAFSDHYPLVLTPDAIWLLIAQGFAQHINNHAERLRHRCVSHQGKMTIKVRRDSFVKGNAENPWPEVFTEFSGAVRDNTVPGVHRLIVPRFSTTGAIEQAAAEITMMDAMKAFFEYEFHTMCGIPRITIEGTLADWVEIRERAIALAEFNLSWWTKELVPVLDQFVAAMGGNPNIKWWEGFFKESDASGGPYIQGHITRFFPYRKDWRTKECTLQCEFPDEDQIFGGMTTESFPSGLSVAPFTWYYYDLIFTMDFVAGFMGFSQNIATKALTPAIGWVVRDRG